MISFEEYEHLAEKIIFLGLKESELLVDWDYRKGKSFADLKDQVKKGMRKGAGKTENEIFEVACGIERVLKKNTTSKYEGIFYSSNEAVVRHKNKGVS